ncbi:putative prophage CPS-53 integrase [compost metagenome]
MSTTLHEQGYPSEWVETQLAHVDKNSIRGTYNHAQYLEGRREMLQWYADHLDALACSSTGNSIAAGEKDA